MRCEKTVPHLNHISGRHGQGDRHPGPSSRSIRPMFHAAQESRLDWGIECEVLNRRITLFDYLLFFNLLNMKSWMFQTLWVSDF